MIAFRKPAAPAVLLQHGPAAARQHSADYAAAPRDYRRGIRSFSFDRSIYAADEVKAALRVAQHDKCAFCESVVTHISHGDIEHFRPKAGYRQRDRDTLKRPGYFWLAYDWDNLFFCCQLCNQRHKRNLFPLRDNRRRARSPTDPLSPEQPLFIDPATQDPSAFIGFRRERAYAVRGCREGWTTIRALGLNRPELVEVRRDRLETLSELVECRNLLVELIAQSSTQKLVQRLQSVERTLQTSRGPASPYSAMAGAFLDANPPPKPK